MNSGLAIRDDLDTTGRLINHGSIMGFRNGVVVSEDFRGSLINHRTITGPQRSGIGIGEDIDAGGSISNYGTIIGQRFGIDIIDQLSGTIFNCGVIHGIDQAGISADRTNGVIRNHGGRIQGGNRAIALGGQNGTVILSGPSHIVSQIQGGIGGGDIIRFENMRGISAAQEAQLVALAAADSTAQTTITLFGETINWINFEDVQVDASSLETYSSVLTGPGLQQFATSLDNINGLNDALRGLLKGLNDANPALLNELASNASGQGQANALQDFARNQDTRLYSLLSNQFSSLRGNISGQPSQTAGVTRTGLFTREVQVGATVHAPSDEVETFLIGFSERGTQNANATRLESAHREILRSCSEEERE